MRPRLSHFSPREVGVARVGERISEAWGGVDSPAESGKVPMTRTARELAPSWRNRRVTAGCWSGMRNRFLALS